MGRHLALFLTMATLAMVPPGLVPAAYGQSDQAREAARRVNISGRQRMLSQRISKAACYMYIGAETTARPNQLTEAAELFATSLEALRRGNVDMGLGPEQSREVRSALVQVAEDWAAFSQHLQMALEEGVVARPALARIDATGRQLLADMTRAVNKTAAFYGESLPDMPLILSLTIDLAGRQRMLTQKAGKEFCLIRAGVEQAENRARLAETTQIFSLTLEALQQGMPGMVMAAPNGEIAAQLEAVARAWAGPKAVLEAAARGENVDAAALDQVVTGLEQVLALMNAAVAMYEGAIPAPPE